MNNDKIPDVGILTRGRLIAVAITAAIAAAGSPGAAALPLPLGSIGVLAPQFGIALGVPVLGVAVLGLGGAAYLATRKKKGKRKG